MEKGKKLSRWEKERQEFFRERERDARNENEEIGVKKRGIY